jgi:hypothetical protein
MRTLLSLWSLCPVYSNSHLLNVMPCNLISKPLELVLHDRIHKEPIYDGTNDGNAGPDDKFRGSPQSLGRVPPKAVLLYVFIFVCV